MGHHSKANVRTTNKVQLIIALFFFLPSFSFLGGRTGRCETRHIEEKLCNIISRFDQNSTNSIIFQINKIYSRGKKKKCLYFSFTTINDDDDDNFSFLFTTEFFFFLYCKKKGLQVLSLSYYYYYSYCLNSFFKHYSIYIICLFFFFSRRCS